jgi:tetrahydromethanopterin S-methyltransferase subunit E
VSGARDGRAEGGAARALRLAIGFVLFQGAWFACVLGAASGQAGQVAIGIAAAAAVVAVLVAWSDDRRAELRLIALALAIGVVWDSLLVHTGVVRYASPGPLPGGAPAWILALWALFAPMLREPLRWLHGRPMLAALFGGVGGALSYAAAERLGACRFPDPTLALAVLAAGWALIVPLLLAAAQRLERPASSRDAAARSCEVGA